MEISDRIYTLRSKLNLSQEEFGKKINVTKHSISSYEKGKNSVKDRVITDICREYSVNEDWLRNGAEPMFIEEDTFSLDEYAKSKGASELEINLIKSWLQIPQEYRDDLLNAFKKDILPKLKKDDEVTATKEIDTNSIDYEVEAYRAELVAESKGETYSVSEDSEEKDLA